MKNLLTPFVLFFCFQLSAQTNVSTKQELINALNTGGIIIVDNEIVVDQIIYMNVTGTVLTGNSNGQGKLTFIDPGNGIADNSGLRVLADSTEISDLTFVGAGVPNGGGERHTINILGCSHILIDKLNVSNCGDTGIRVRWHNDTPASHITISNCTVENVLDGSGIEILRSNNIIITNNIISNCYQSGVRLAGTNSTLVSDNIIQNVNSAKVQYHGGIYALGGGQTYLNFVSIRDNYIHTTTNGIVAGNQTSNMSIKSNTIEIDDDINDAVKSIAIYLKDKPTDDFGYKNIFITDNNITGNHDTGIFMESKANSSYPDEDARNIIISNNTIEDFRIFAVVCFASIYAGIKEVQIIKNHFSIDSNEIIRVRRCNDVFICKNFECGPPCSIVTEDDIYFSYPADDVQFCDDNSESNNASNGLTTFKEKDIVFTRNFKNKNFKIFPNPSSGLFNIDLDENLDVKSISIYNTIGKKVKSLNDRTIDLSNNSPGLYYIEIETNDQKFIEKIILKE